MMTAHRRSAAIAVFVALFGWIAFAGAVHAQAPQSQTPQAQFSPAQTGAIESIIREYLLRNPELLLEAMDKLDKRREDEVRSKAQAALSERRDELLNDPDAPVRGPATADVTIVEFFDYRCPYCKQMIDPIARLLKDDRKVRLVLKEYPILGPDSLVASRAALAARMQGKYFELHDAMMAARGTLDEATVLSMATKAGLNAARLKTDMNSPQVDKIIERNTALARALQFNGTPSFVIGDAMIPGAVEPDTLKKLVADARKTPAR